MSKVYGTRPLSGAVPVVPTGLFLEFKTAYFFIFSWDDAGDAVSWTVYVDGVPYTPVNEPTATLAGFSPLSAHDIQIQANGVGASSALSSPQTFTTDSNTPPVWNIPAQTGVVGEAVNLVLPTLVDDLDGQPLALSVASGGIPGCALSPDGTTYQGTLTTAGNFSVDFDAFDGYDHSIGTASFTVATVGDTTAPTIPQNVTAVAATSTVTVDWDESTDTESGVAFYRIYRDGVQVATDGIPPKQLTGVPDGTYVFSVSAQDNAGNLSAAGFAAPVTVSTSPTLPGIPINLNAQLTSVDDAAITWAPDPNGAAPTSYVLQHSIQANGGSATGPWSTVATSGVNTSASDLNLPNGRTWYRIQAVNGAGSSAFSSVVFLDVIIPTGNATFQIPLGTTDWDGSVARVPLTGGAARSVRGGDIIEFEAGTYRDFVFRSVIGNASNRVVIRPPSSGQVIFRRLAPASGGFLVQFRGCRYFTFDGSTTSPAVPVTRDGKRHGFKFMYAQNATGTNKDGVTAYVKFKGLLNSPTMTANPATCSPYTNTRNCTFRYCHFNGGWSETGTSFSTDTGGICFDTNDHNYKRALANGTHTAIWGEWMEDLVFEHFLVEDIGGEATYIGPNPYQTFKGTGSEAGGPDIPVRYVKVRYFMIYHIGGQGIQLKSTYGGQGGTDGPTDNSVHDGVIIRALAEVNSGTNGTPAIILNSSKTDVYNMWVEGCGAGAFTAQVSDGTGVDFPDAPNTTFQSRVYNCVFVDNNAVASFNGIRAASSTIANPALPAAFKQIVKAYNNTILRHTGGSAIRFDGSANSQSWARNNLIIESGSVSLASGSENNNVTTGTAAATFVDAVGNYLNGNINLHLLVAKPASGTVGTDIAPTDMPPTGLVHVGGQTGVIRVAATADVGAYEKP